MILGMKIPQRRVSLRQMTDYGAGHTCVMAVAHCVPSGKVILGTGYSGEISKVEFFAKLRERSAEPRRHCLGSKQAATTCSDERNQLRENATRRTAPSRGEGSVLSSALQVYKVRTASGPSWCFSSFSSLFSSSVTH